MNLWLIIMWTWLFLGFIGFIVNLLDIFFTNQKDNKEYRKLGFIIFLSILCTLIGPVSVYIGLKDLIPIIKNELKQKEDETYSE